VSEILLEWNLGFAFDEVVEGLEKMCTTRGYVRTRTDCDGETVFSLSLWSGTLELSVKPLSSYRSPFGHNITWHRTLLTVSETGVVTPQEREIFRQHLTLAFLRAGG
jgi:hypothetical protein